MLFVAVNIEYLYGLCASLRQARKMHAIKPPRARTRTHTHTRIQKPKWVKVKTKPDKKLESRKRLDDANTNMSNNSACIYISRYHLYLYTQVTLQSRMCSKSKHQKHLLTFAHKLLVWEFNKQESLCCKIIVVWLLVSNGVPNVFFMKNDIHTHK